MSLRLGVSIILLLAIIVSGILTTTYIESFCKEIIERTKNASEERDINKLASIKNKWIEKTIFLSAIIPHDHVDSITESIDKAITFLKYGTEDEFSAEITKFVNALTVLRDYDKPSLRSIF